MAKIVTEVFVTDKDGNIDIDWSFMKIITTSNCTVPTRRKNKPDEVPNKEKFVFKPELFQDAVVMPSYRNIDQPQYFYVAEIRHDLNPRSSFPSPDLYSTFEQYYTKKYGLVITNPEQPLLDVDHTSVRLNLLTPRYMNQKGMALPTSSAETRRARRENLQQKQILVPELCDVHPFPASLWRKVVCLPAILYRMNYLLISEELRVLMSGKANIGITHLDDDYRFPKLDFGFSTDPREAKVKETTEDDDSESENEVENCQQPVNSENEHLNVTKGTVEESDDLTNDRNIIKDTQGETSDKICDTMQGEIKTTDDDLIGELENRVILHTEDMNENSPTLDHAGNFIDPNENTSVSNVQSSTPNVEHNANTEHKSQSTSHEESLNSSTQDNYDTIKFETQEVDLDTFIGPSPCTILQTLTMSNANDFFNLERLETIGDSFLKFTVTVHLYCTYSGIHEGKLSYLRSKQVSNYNLYKLGKRQGFPECMISAKFEPYENWLPPGYVIRDGGLSVQMATIGSWGEKDGLPDNGCVPGEPDSDIDTQNGNVPACDTDANKNMSGESKLDGGNQRENSPEVGASLSKEQEKYNDELQKCCKFEDSDKLNKTQEKLTLVPYDLRTQQSLPDKSIADCVEAIIGCYLTTCGEKGALKFMHWLGLKVLVDTGKKSEIDTKDEHLNESCELLKKGMFRGLKLPPSPLLGHVPNAAEILEFRLSGYETFEKKINYRFKDRSYLLQAFTHASYHYNNVTDCYQRLVGQIFFRIMNFQS